MSNCHIGMLYVPCSMYKMNIGPYGFRVQPPEANYSGTYRVTCCSWLLLEQSVSESVWAHVVFMLLLFLHRHAIYTLDYTQSKIYT